MYRERMKKVGLWILTLSLIVAHIFFRSQANAALPWTEVVASKCQIEFPVLPQKIEQQLKLEEGLYLSYEVYIAPFDSQSVCVLLVTQYPHAIEAGTEMAGLAGLLRGIVNHHPDNQPVFADMVRLHGFPALNFMIQSGKNFFRAQAVMAGNRLYMIAMEGTKEHFDETAFQRFLKSFKIHSQD
jgi:hypothetical protein